MDKDKLVNSLLYDMGNKKEIIQYLTKDIQDNKEKK